MIQVVIVMQISSNQEPKIITIEWFTLASGLMGRGRVAEFWLTPPEGTSMKECGRLTKNGVSASKQTIGLRCSGKVTLRGTCRMGSAR